jgi:hypothetical protein
MMKQTLHQRQQQSQGNTSFRLQPSTAELNIGTAPAHALV